MNYQRHIPHPVPPTGSGSSGSVTVQVVRSDPPSTEIAFRYRNWRGETADRRVLISSVWFGSTSYHPEPQWIMSAIDIEKWEMRDFAMKDMTEVRFK